MQQRSTTTTAAPRLRVCVCVFTSASLNNVHTFRFYTLGSDVCVCAKTRAVAVRGAAFIHLRTHNCHVIGVELDSSPPKPPPVPLPVIKFSSLSSAPNSHT